MIDKEKLVESYYPIVRRMVKKLVVRMPDGYDEEDFVQVGMMGLLKALEAADSKKTEAELRAYAQTKIRGAILDKLRSVDKLSRYTRDKLKKIAEAYRELMQEGNLNPTEKDVAEKAGMDEEEIGRLMGEGANLDMLSLDETLSDGDTLIMEAVEDKRTRTPLEMVEENEREELIREALSNLSEQELTVLSLYYHEDLNIKEIASIIGKTESRVSQIKTQSLMKVREYIRRRLNR